MVRFLPLLLLPCLLAVPAGAEDEVVELPETSVLERLQAELDAVTEDVLRVSREADRDPRELQIDEYLRYEGEDWDRRGRIEAEDLVKDIMADTSVDFLVRQRVKDAIIKQMVQDPDLSKDRNRNRQSPCARFSSYVVADDVLGARRMDARGAKLANDLLLALWPAMRQVQVRDRFQPEQRQSRMEAEDAWKTWLEDR